MDPTYNSKTWIRKQRLLRDMLIRCRGASDPTHLRSLIDRALHCYEAHYRARSDFARSDPAHAFLSPLATPLERAVYWISGWRPNTLIHLFYTESGLKLEAQLYDLLAGAHSGDIGDISPVQLCLIDELQRRTVKDEIEIDDELGRIQERVPDPFPPSDSDLDLKMERVGRMMGRADELRMRTLRAVVEILDPLQAVDLLVAAADLEVGVHGLGFTGSGWSFSDSRSVSRIRN